MISLCYFVALIAIISALDQHWIWKEMFDTMTQLRYRALENSNPKQAEITLWDICMRHTTEQHHKKKLASETAHEH